MNYRIFGGVLVIGVVCGVAVWAQEPQMEAEPAAEPEALTDPLAQPEPAPPAEPEPEPESSPAELVADAGTPRGALLMLAEAMEAGDVQRIRERIHAEDEAEERVAGALAEMAEAIAQMRQAAKEAFGDQGANQLIGRETALEDTRARLTASRVEIDNDRAVVTSPTMEARPVRLVRIDQDWKLPVDSLFPPMEAEQREAQIRRLGVQAAVMREFSGEIAAGGHESAQAAAQALETQMLRAFADLAAEQAPAETEPPQEQVDPEQAPDAPE